MLLFALISYYTTPPNYLTTVYPACLPVHTHICSATDVDLANNCADVLHCSAGVSALVGTLMYRKFSDNACLNKTTLPF